MIRKFHWAAAVLFLLPVSAESNSGIIQVTGVRAWSHPESTRVILEMTGAAEYRVDRATSPDRLFLDIDRARPWIDKKRFALRQVNDRLVKRVRIAETAPGTTRIVFDLNSNTDYSISRLETPDRLVIELTPHSATPHSATPRPAPLVSAMVTSTTRKHTATRAYTAPVLPVAARRMVLAPEWTQPVPFVESGAFAPYQLAGSWTTLPTVHMPKKAIVAAVTPATPTAIPPPSQPPPPATYVNTTTKVLPAGRANAGSPNVTAKASSDASLSLTRALGLKINRIVIDAGHGGHDEGTSGPNGVLEKDVVLDVALRLATLVQTRLGAEVVLTRSDDTFVPLTERTAIANEHRADLFLSIHANSSSAATVAGTETFLLNLNSSPGAVAVAARENAGSDKSVGELRDLVQSIAQNDKIAESQNFATDIQTAIFMQEMKSNAAAHDRGVKRAPFVVLIGARMPSVLAEIGFLTNPRDESNLGKPEYRQKVAESLYRGIAQYSQSLSHFEVAGADSRVSGYSGTGSK